MRKYKLRYSTVFDHAQLNYGNKLWEYCQENNIYFRNLRNRFAIGEYAAVLTENEAIILKLKFDVKLYEIL